MTSMRMHESQRRYFGAAIDAGCPSPDFDGAIRWHEQRLLSSSGSPP